MLMGHCDLEPYGRILGGRGKLAESCSEEIILGGSPAERSTDKLRGCRMGRGLQKS